MLKMATTNLSPRCIAFEFRIFNDSIGIRLRPRLHDTVFISYRIGFISDWPSVYTIPFSFHIGLASCWTCYKSLSRQKREKE